MLENSKITMYSDKAGLKVDNEDLDNIKMKKDTDDVADWLNEK